MKTAQLSPNGKAQLTQPLLLHNQPAVWIPPGLEGWACGWPRHSGSIESGSHCKDRCALSTLLRRGVPSWLSPYLQLTQGQAYEQCLFLLTPWP